MVKKITKTFQERVKKMPKYLTPGTPGQGLQLATGDEKIDENLHKLYRTGVGMLLYLIKFSRPEIANAVRELSKCISAPTDKAFKEMLRVCKYVMDTSGKGLRVQPVETPEWLILLFTDSDWAGDKGTRKSVSGFMLFVNGVLVRWRSKSQQVVSLSSS